MPTYEFSVPGVTCSICTGTIDNTLDVARKEKKLYPAIRSVNIDLTHEPPRAFVEVDETLQDTCQMHFLSELPHDLHAFKGSYLLVNSQLYYVLPNAATETVRLNNPQQFLTELSRIRQGDASNLELSAEQEQQLITCNGHYNRLGAEAVKANINSLIDDIGFEFTPVLPTKIEVRNHICKGIVGLITGSLMLGLCISGLGLPLVVTYILGFIGTALTFYLGKETYLEAFKKLKVKQLTMHSLFSVSTLTALGISFASFFVPWLPMMFDTALLIFGFIHIGKAYEKSTKRSINRASSYRALAPAKILTRLAEGHFEEKLIHNIKAETIIRVKRGQVIGLDGHYLPEEKSEKCTTIINPYSGSTIPQVIQPGAMILAGSIVPQDLDFIDLVVSAPEEESYLATLEKQSKAARAGKAPLETFAAKVLQWFVPIVLGLALVSALVIGFLFTPLTALQVAATILASACPCTLGLIIPLAIKVGFIKANTEGVQFASSESLQAAEKVNAVVVDITGTLTTGEIQVTSGLEEKPATNLSLKMLDHLAAIEQFSEHPFASAIRRYVHDKLKRPVAFAPPVTLQEKLHSGLIATINHKTYIVGNKDLMQEQGFSAADLEAAEIADHEAEHVVYLSCDGKIQGCILLSDPLRKEAPEVLRALQDQGKEIHICTGVSQKTAELYVRQLERLGVKPIPKQHIIGNCLPDSENEEAITKTAHIKRLKAQGFTVGMIGDGLNDSPAFDNSHFKIAIESGIHHQITQGKADAVILKVNNQLSLRSILSIFTIANQTVKNIKQNLAISLSYNLLTALTIGGLLIGLGFILNPALGAALMFFQSALILTNVQRFKSQKLAYSNDPHWESSNRQIRRNLSSLLPRLATQKTQDDFSICYKSHAAKTVFSTKLFQQNRPFRESVQKITVPLLSNHLDLR